MGDIHESFKDFDPFASAIGLENIADKVTLANSVSKASVVKKGKKEGCC